MDIIKKSEEFKNIRDIYEIMMPNILDSYPYIDTHFYPFFENMSPIEKLLWYDIKDYGLPLYPQFPIGRYFVDFGDPVKKIAIEADGREFHKDIQKDTDRQLKIESEGWKVYRITGSEIHNDESSESFIKQIKNNHYCDKNYETIEDDLAED